MITEISKHQCFAGMQYVYSHVSQITHCSMRFGLYLPPIAKQQKIPVLFWLSGLTATEENFIIKAGAQRFAAKWGVAILTPDTSPRGENLPDDSANDLGTGAGFYVDATKAPWSHAYQMYSYLTQELPSVISQSFPLDMERAGIFGHSMGGHGALIIALNHPRQFKTVSAFAPIASPLQSPWGQKAFNAYFTNVAEASKKYDATALLRSQGWQGPPILIDQGVLDPFVETQLKPQLLIEACAKANVALRFRWQEGYDHSYFFIASFIEDHIQFHAENLSKT